MFSSLESWGQQIFERKHSDQPGSISSSGGVTPGVTGKDLAYLAEQKIEGGTEYTKPGKKTTFTVTKIPLRVLSEAEEQEQRNRKDPYEQEKDWVAKLGDNL